MDAVTIDARDDGYMVIEHKGNPEPVKIFVPVLKRNNVLNSREGFCADALDSCLKYVPQIPGMTTEFKSLLSNFDHRDSSDMLTIFQYTALTHMYHMYDENNPGHLMIALQCFGGWWAGLATQMFLSALLSRCKSLALMKNCLREGVEIDMALNVVACICKAFGCAATLPTIPVYPKTSKRVHPTSVMADLIGRKNDYFKKAGIRELLIHSLNDWSVPNYMKDSLKSYRLIWQIDDSYIQRASKFEEYFYENHVF